MNSKRVLITGGTGLLALNWACSIRNQWDVILGLHHHDVSLALTRSQRLNLELPEDLSKQIANLAPDLIVHTVGMTNVDECEKNYSHALHINASVAVNVAMVAKALNIPLIHISTDQLFQGDRSFYSETDSVEPINTYGVTKAFAEARILEVDPKALIIRTNFFGWGHSQRRSFSDWLIYSLRAGQNLNLFEDAYFTPILADTLALASHDLFDKGISGVVNVVGDERVSKYHFAQILCKTFNLPSLHIRYAKVGDSDFLASRPLDMSLDNGKLCKILGKNMGGISDFLYKLRDQELVGRRAELFNAVN